MRQLKFRVWDNLKKEWVSNKSIWRMKTDPNGIGEIEPNAFYWKQHPQGLTIQQFTGLIDKNEKEIYEGDIIEMSDGSVGVVKFDKGYFFHTGKSEIMGMLYWDTIIGNIFENPELLKQ